MFKKRTESGVKEAQPAPVTNTKPQAGGGAARVATAPSQSARQASAPSPGKKSARGFTQEQIAQRAYQLWEKRGKAHGSDLEDWLEAERELVVGR
jgi:hypothetical protein